MLAASSFSEWQRVNDACPTLEILPVASVNTVYKIEVALVNS